MNWTHSVCAGDELLMILLMLQWPAREGESIQECGDHDSIFSDHFQKKHLGNKGRSVGSSSNNTISAAVSCIHQNTVQAPDEKWPNYSRRNFPIPELP